MIRLREEFHVYMVESSRVNIAGINHANVDRVADVIAAVLKWRSCLTRRAQRAGVSERARIQAIC